MCFLDLALAYLAIEYPNLFLSLNESAEVVTDQLCTANSQLEPGRLTDAVYFKGTCAGYANQLLTFVALRYHVKTTE